MIFYITPVIDESGQHYEVQKWEQGFFRYKIVGVLDETGSVDFAGQELGVYQGEKFKSVADAVKFIRKHYGDKTIIGKWRG